MSLNAFKSPTSEAKVVATGGGGLLQNVACAGGAAVITVTFIHPIDVVKTRLQVSGSGGGRNYAELGIGGSVSVIAKEEGVTAFWKGINAAWLRESSYTSLRLGLYAPIKELMGATSPDAPFYLKFGSGSLAGAIGSLAGNPFDVLKVRSHFFSSLPFWRRLPPHACVPRPVRSRSLSHSPLSPPALVVTFRPA